MSHPSANLGLVRIPPGHPDYSRWAVNRGEPAGPQRAVDPPAPALADVELYEGTREVLEVHVVATARGAVCISHDVPGRGPWLAWVPAERARRA